MMMGEMAVNDKPTPPTPTPPVTEITITTQPTALIETYFGRDWTVSVSAVAPEGTELEYQWYAGRNEMVAIPGATSSTLTTNFFELGMEYGITFDEDTEGNIMGVLYCVVSDASGTLDSVTSDSVHFKDLRAVVTIDSQTPSTESDIPATLGDDITLSFTWSSTDTQDEIAFVMWYKIVGGGSPQELDTTTVPTLTWTVDEACDIFAVIITHSNVDGIETDPWTIIVE